MMDFTYNRIYINNDALATSGAVRQLTTSQLGIFDEAGAIAGVAQAPTAKYLKFAQGTAENIALQSDEIWKNYDIHARVVAGKSTSTLQEGELEFTGDMYCGETIVVNLRVHSHLIKAVHPMGYNFNYTAETPCCDCDDDSCTAITAGEKTAVIAELVAKMTADKFLKNYLTITAVGADKIKFVAKIQNTVTGYQGSFRDVHMYDLVTFSAEIHKGATTSQDMILESEPCDETGTFAITQEAEYPQGLPSQVRRVYARYVSNNLAEFRALPHNEGLVGEFEPAITEALYDQVVIKAYVKQNRSWTDAVPQDFGIIIYTKPSETDSITDVLTAFGIDVEGA